MEKQLIDFDQSRYEQTIGSYETFKKLIEQAINIFNSCELGSFVPKDLQSLILYTEKYVKSRVIEKNDITALTAMGLSREKVLEMLAMPAQLPTLLEKVNQLERIFQQTKERDFLPVQNLKHLLTYYYFDEKNRLVLKADIIESCQKNFETYIETKAAKNLFDFASEMVALYEKYDIKVSNHPENVRFLQNLLTVKNEAAAININSILDMERRSK